MFVGILALLKACAAVLVSTLWRKLKIAKVEQRLLAESLAKCCNDVEFSASMSLKNRYRYFQALKREKLTFSKLEMRIFIANMYHLPIISAVELLCEFLPQLIMEMNRQRYTTLLLFGWKMWKPAALRSVSSKVAEVLKLTPPSIGLHSKAPNQASITERQVFNFLQRGQNAIEWIFLRYGYVMVEQRINSEV